MTIIISITLLIIVFFAIGPTKIWTYFFGSADLGAIEFATFTPSIKPNHALFCPMGYCANAMADKVTPTFDLEIDMLKHKLLTIINAEQNIEMVASDDENYEYRFVHYTKLMRFPDTIL
ncbi:MAG: hypothetical protein HRU28_18475 [Rhizobiales bacterium]|nr:hypothetical protein [Hyphomicrobiales bacterium]